MVANASALLKLGFEKEGILKKAVKGYNGIIYDDVLFKNQSNLKWSFDKSDYKHLFQKSLKFEISWKTGHFKTIL